MRRSLPQLVDRNAGGEVMVSPDLITSRQKEVENLINTKENLK